MLSSCDREGLINNMPFWISRRKQITLGKTNTQLWCIRKYLNCPYRTKGRVGVPTEVKQVRSAIPERFPPNVTKKKSTIIWKARNFSSFYLPKIPSAVAGIEQSLEKGLIASGNKLFGGERLGSASLFLT